MFDVKTDFSVYRNCYFFVNHYAADNSLMLRIYNNIDGAIADITVCLDDKFLKDNQAYVDTNNSEFAPKLIKELGIGKPLGKTRNSGFCTYPLYEFDLEKIGEVSR